MYNSIFVTLNAMNALARLAQTWPEYYKNLHDFLYWNHYIWREEIIKHNPEANAEAEAY